MIHQVPLHERLQPWYNPDGPDRPRTPEPFVGPESPRSRSILHTYNESGVEFHPTRFFCTPTPVEGMYARHREGSTIYFDRPVVEGDRFRWRETGQIWVANPMGLWINRDWVYMDGEWNWMVGKTFTLGIGTPISFKAWYVGSRRRQ
jgi:hypothetical protein